MINSFLSAAFQTGLSTPNRFNNFLILAYVVMGLIALLYVASLYIRQRNVQKDVALMRQLLDEDEPSAH